jgi:hypothetical protein
MAATTTPKSKPVPVVVVGGAPRSLLEDIAIGVFVGVVTLELVRRLHR